MKLSTDIHDDLVVAYRLWLTVEETAAWSRKSGTKWPCSMLAGLGLWVATGQNGLEDCVIDGRDVCFSHTSNELEACVGDHLPDNCKHLWPTWVEKNE